MLIRMVAPYLDVSPARRCLAVRNVRLFLGGQAISQTGTWLQLVALGWLALEVTGHGAALGWLVVAMFGPLLLLGPWTGALADRVNRYRLLAATQALAVVQAGALGALVLSGAATELGLYLLTLGYGFVHAVDNPARRAFVSDLVGEDLLPNAVSLHSTATAAGRVLGPVIASGLVPWAGIGWCFLVNAAGGLVALTGLIPIRRKDLRRGEPTQEPGGALAGLRYSWGVPELRTALLLTAVVATFGFNHQVLIPLLADRAFGGGSGAYTLLYAAMSVGSVLGALAVSRVREVDLRFLAGAVIAFAAANGLVALSPSLALAVIATAAAGATGMLFITGSTVLLQRLSAPAMRGRVMALSAMVLLGGLPVGAPIVGWIGDLAGPRAAIALGSVTALAAGVLTLRPLGLRPPEMSWGRGPHREPVDNRG
jgi:MFS family permease